jgi:hypothetical protein
MSLEMPPCPTGDLETLIDSAERGLITVRRSADACHPLERTLVGTAPPLSLIR